MAEKFLLLESIHPVAQSQLVSEGYEVELLEKSLKEDELIAKLAGVQVLGIRSKTQVTPRILDAAKDLVAIGAFCIGTNQVALEHAIAEARAAATRVGEHAPAPPAADLSALRADIDETWRGMLAITWTLPSAEISVRHVDRIGNVVQECLANASIHGSATAASVRIAAEGDGIVVEIADNGSGPTGGGPGLGSAVLNEATASRWTIAAAADGGAQVRAVIPV